MRLVTASVQQGCDQMTVCVCAIGWLCECATGWLCICAIGWLYVYVRSNDCACMCDRMTVCMCDRMTQHVCAIGWLYVCTIGWLCVVCVVPVCHCISVALADHRSLGTEERRLVVFVLLVVLGARSRQRHVQRILELVLCSDKEDKGDWGAVLVQYSISNYGHRNSSVQHSKSAV